MRLIRTEYTINNNKPVIYLFCRDEKGNQIITTDKEFKPYFYVPSSEISTARRNNLESEGIMYATADDDTAIKVFTTLPKDISEIRDDFNKHYEADVLYQNRYLIDKVDVLDKTTLRVFYIDIEVDAEKKIPDVRDPKRPINGITVYDDLTEQYHTYVFRPDITEDVEYDLIDGCPHTTMFFSNERSMLNAFNKYVSENYPDVFTGWNCQNFDMPYLVNRETAVGINKNILSPIRSVYTRDDKQNVVVVIKGIAIVDMLTAYKKMTIQAGDEESYKLDYIATKVTGEGKEVYTGTLHDLWMKHLEKFISYNVTDVKRVKNIDKKMQIINFLDEVRRLTFCQLEDTLSASRTLDCYFLRFFHNRKVFLTKQHHEAVEYEGAFIGTWAKGIYDNVIFFDVKSMYPSILCSCNMGPDTVVDTSPDNTASPNYIHINDKVAFKKSPKSYVAELVESLFSERAKYKSLMKKEKVDSEMYTFYDRRQYAVKVLLNAIYGQMAYVGSRLFEPRVAEAITFMGRQMNQWSRELLTSLGYQVLYADTDSVAFSAGPVLDRDKIKGALNQLNESYSTFAKQYNIDKHIFTIELDKIFRKAFFGEKKKRYCGNCIFESDQNCDIIIIKGFETRRSDVARFSRKLQADIFRMLLKEDKSKRDIIEYIKSEIKRVRSGGYEYAEIGIPKGITKNLSEYTVNTANIRGARYSESILKIDVSNKPKMIYVSKMPQEYPPTDVIVFDEEFQVPAGTQVDTEKMLEKLVKDKVESIFDALGWKLGELDKIWGNKSEKLEAKGQIKLL